MKFEETITAWGGTTFPSVFHDAWEQYSLDSRPLPTEQYTNDAISEAATILGLPNEVTSACLDAAYWVRTTPAALRYAELCRTMLREEPPERLSEIRPWPMIPSETGVGAELFYAVVFLAHLPETLQANRRRGIDDAISLATLSDLQLWIEEYRAKTGRLGLDEVHWLWKHFAGRIFQLGRLQFERGAFACPFRVYRNLDGRTVALAEGNLRFRTDGQFDGCNGIHDPRAWGTTLRETRESVAGHSTDLEGNAQRETTTLSRDEWTEMLRQGDPGLFVHIPSGREHGPLTPTACEASFAQAESFFPNHFPEDGGSAFFSETWMFDGQLAHLLPEHSNIVQFQHSFHLLPTPAGDDKQTLERVFGGAVEDWSQAPRDSSLQRTLADFAQAGGRFHKGYGYRFAGQG